MRPDTPPALKEHIRKELSFWHWLHQEGLRRLRDRWAFAHGSIGALLAWSMDTPLSTIATSALIPIGSLIVGLAFAWSGNIGALLQSVELQEIGTHDNGRTFRNWVFTYQLAVLVVLTTACVWSLIAAGFFENGIVGTAIAWTLPEWSHTMGRALAFALMSLTVRECWQVALGTPRKILAQRLQQQAKVGALELQRSVNTAAESDAVISKHEAVSDAPTAASRKSD